MIEGQVPRTIELAELQIGDLLAEGGEGQVFLMPRQPHLVFKRYRRPQDRGYLDQLVAWPATLPEPDHADRLGSSTAWPASVVTEKGRAVGLLMARAPRRFALRHRDGQSRLASLSYLTADPKHRAVAYGLHLPPPLSVPRLDLARALAQVLSVFEAGRPPVAHGDLSTKNVLWSLQRGPEVFLIDCDSSELEGSGSSRRRRAMTPNWNDPAVAPGANPGPTTDRYSMALIFLRVAGAANFPIQARQRAGGAITLEVPVPSGPTAAVLLDPEAPVWDLCARGLSLVAPDDRPPASAWLGVLGQLLAGLGSGRPAAEPAAIGWQLPTRPSDVRIVPVRAGRAPARSYARVSPAPRYGGRPAAVSPAGPGPGGFGYRPVGGSAPVGTWPGGATSQTPPAGPIPRGGPAQRSSGAGLSPAGTPQPPAGAYQPPAGTPQPPAGAPQPPAGAYQPTAGAYRSATGALSSAGAAQPAGGSGLRARGNWSAAAGVAREGGDGDASEVGSGEVRAQIVRMTRWWVRRHGAALAALVARGRRLQGLRALLACAAADLVLVAVAAFAVAMVVAPILGI